MNSFQPRRWTHKSYQNSLKIRSAFSTRYDLAQCPGSVTARYVAFKLTLSFRLDRRNEPRLLQYVNNIVSFSKAYSFLTSLGTQTAWHEQPWLTDDYALMARQMPKHSTQAAMFNALPGVERERLLLEDALYTFMVRSFPRKLAIPSKN
jgi:hypothetical protein